MAERSHKRRQILVDTELQLGMSVKLIGWLYLYIFAFALLVNAPSIWAIATGSEGDAAYLDAVDRLHWFANLTMLPLALTFVAVAAHSVLFTHRVAGPIHRFKAVLSGLSARKFPESPVTLRDGDYFNDVADELNKVVDAQREDAARQRRMNGEISAGIRDLTAAIDEARVAKPELLALAKLALDRTERLDRHLAAVERKGAPASPPPGDSSAGDATYVTREPAEPAGR